MTNNICAMSEQRAAIMAVIFQLEIGTDSVRAAIAWLSNDIRTSGIERELSTVLALANESRADLQQLQSLIWREFGIDTSTPQPANDDTQG